MLTSLRIQNFKSWRDTDEIRLAPLTVIFGANSSGKSSLGHLLLALKQTAISADRNRALNLGDSNTLIDLGTFSECIHNHDVKQKMGFHLGWRLSDNLVVKNPIGMANQYEGDSLELDVSLLATDARARLGRVSSNDPAVNYIPRVEALKYVLKQGENKTLAFELTRAETGKWAEPKSHPLKLIKAIGRKWPIEEPEKFYRFSETSIARYQNAGFMTDFALATETMLKGLFYLGPLRERPRRTYLWSGNTPDDVGRDGENAVAAMLAADEAGRSLNRRKGAHQHIFGQFIAGWLKELGIIETFDVRPLAQGRKDYEVVIKTDANAAEVKISDVGIGVSQVLPALVQAFYCPRNSTVWMEQPEIHLHPRIQAELADAFISAVQSWEKGRPRNVQLIVESHSEHFLSRLQRRIAENAIQIEDVAIYFVRRSGSASTLEELRLNGFGDIENWPENFFGDEMADATARMVAAAKPRAPKSTAP